MRALVFAAESRDFARILRTIRSLAAAGVESRVVPTHAELAGELLAASEPQWLVRAGAWQPLPAPIRPIPRSASGRPLIGLGGPGAVDDVASLYLEVEPARLLARHLRESESWQAAVRSLLRNAKFRSVPLHDIRVRFDPSLRVVQVTTTIQIGGAERVTLDLADQCNRLGVPTLLAALGLPTRRAFPSPRWSADLSETPFDPLSRAAAVERLCLEWGADIIHAHLVRASEAEAMRARGIPLALTVHNIATSWPPGYLEAQQPFADLLIGCAEAVTREVKTRLPAAATKTVWNGIDPCRSRVAEPSSTAASVRENLGWDGSDFVLLAVANPRPQKRLERLPEIMARLEERIAPRRVRLIIAGQAAEGSEDARQAVARLDAEIERWHAQKAIHWSGAVDDVAPLLAAADVFISTSVKEGLSLAQLEALAAGIPVVAPDVGGAAVVAARSDRFFLVPRDADAEIFARVLARLADAPPPRIPALPKSFTRERMATRTHLLYGGMLVRANRDLHTRRPVWLITNNFSIGGAQTSARRLLTGLAARGHSVRAATIEEAPERPGPGRRALAAAGVPVTPIAPNPNPEALVIALLEAMSADPPHAVLYWNLITPVKVLLADAMIDLPIYDVSPGEMYFQSLDRFFAAPPPGLPLETARAYGAALAGVAVKYAAEKSRAAEVLGVPVHVIPNGVPIARAARSDRRQRSLVIGTAARLSPDKRLDQLLAAVRHAHARLPRYELRIAGGAEADTSYAKELRALARGLPVKWCGHVDDIPAFLANLDLFAMISEPAGCPNASLEAMAAGLPIVATDHGGAREQVISGTNGLLVPRGDIEAFAEALVTLATDHPLRLKMGEASRSRAETAFGMERMLDSYSALLGLAS